MRVRASERLMQLVGPKRGPMCVYERGIIKTGDGIRQLMVVMNRSP